MPSRVALVLAHNGVEPKDLGSHQADKHELDPRLSHVGIFDRHDRKESNTLRGVADLADAVLSGPVEGVGSVDTPFVTESGGRTRAPLVLRRDEIALDDYESAAEVLYRSCWYAPRRAPAPRHRLIPCESEPHVFRAIAKMQVECGSYVS